MTARQTRLLASALMLGSTAVFFFDPYLWFAGAEISTLTYLSSRDIEAKP
jgi:hypothetical protein